MKAVCSICGEEKEGVKMYQKIRLIKIRVCRSCYHSVLQPKKSCSVCGKNLITAGYVDEKPFCTACWKRISGKLYSSNKRWRRRNPGAWNDSKKRNYERGAVNTENEKRRYAPEELERIIASDRPCDRQLAIELGRSVQALQVKRSYLMKKVKIAK